MYAVVSLLTSDCPFISAKIDMISEAARQNIDYIQAFTASSNKEATGYLFVRLVALVTTKALLLIPGHRNFKSANRELIWEQPDLKCNRDLNLRLPFNLSCLYYCICKTRLVAVDHADKALRCCWWLVKGFETSPYIVCSKLQSTPVGRQ